MNISSMTSSSPAQAGGTSTVSPQTQTEESVAVADVAQNEDSVKAVDEVEQEKPKEKDAFAEKIELLSRKERAIWREKQRIEQERQALAQERAEYEKFKALKAKAKHDPNAYLSEAGLSYDEITEFMLNGGKPSEPDELQALREEFKRLKEERDEEKKQAKTQKEQAEIQAQTRAIENFKTEISDFIEQNKDKYELSALRDSTEDVYNTINDAFVIAMNEWNTNGRMGQPPAPMSIEEAANIVEEFYEKEVLRLAESNKLKSRFSGASQVQEPASPSKAPSKTLMNNMASTAASVIPAKNDADRMRRALEKLG